MPAKKRKAVVALVGLTIGLLISRYLFTPIEQFRLQSPDGEHTAVVTSYRLWNLVEMLSSATENKPAHVEILDKNGHSLGNMPVPRIAMARRLQWIEHGAHIRLVGTWNFQDGFYAYWNDDQTRMHMHSIN